MQVAQIRGVPKIGGVPERKNRIGATKLPNLYGRGERIFWNYLILFIVIIIIRPQAFIKLYYCDLFLIISTLLLSIVTSITWTKYIV